VKTKKIRKKLRKKRLAVDKKKSQAGGWRGLKKRWGCRIKGRQLGKNHKGGKKKKGDWTGGNIDNRTVGEQAPD